MEDLKRFVSVAFNPVAVLFYGIEVYFLFFGGGASLLPDAVRPTRPGDRPPDDRRCSRSRRPSSLEPELSRAMRAATGERPVMIVARDGTHCGAPVNMRRNIMPSAAMRSRLGVFISLRP